MTARLPRRRLGAGWFGTVPTPDGHDGCRGLDVVARDQAVFAGARELRQVHAEIMRQCARAESSVRARRAQLCSAAMASERASASWAGVGARQRCLSRVVVETASAAGTTAPPRPTCSPLRRPALGARAVADEVRLRRGTGIRRPSGWIRAHPRPRRRRSARPRSRSSGPTYSARDDAAHTATAARRWPSRSRPRRSPGGGSPCRRRRRATFTISDSVRPSPRSGSRKSSSTLTSRPRARSGRVRPSAGRRRRGCGRGRAGGGTSSSRGRVRHVEARDPHGRVLEE